MILGKKMARQFVDGRKSQARVPVHWISIAAKPKLVRLRGNRHTQPVRTVAPDDPGPKTRAACPHRKGRDYALQRGRGLKAVKGLRVLVTDTPRIERLGDITLPDAIAEGHKTRQEFFEYWTEMHGELDMDLEVWVLAITPVVEERHMAARIAEGELIGDVRDYVHTPSEAAKIRKKGPPEGGVPPIEWQEQRSKEGRESFATFRAEQLRELDALPLDARVAALLKMEEKGANVSRELRAVEKSVKAAERKAGLRVAA